jgi:hypothetical protein
MMLRKILATAATALLLSAGYATVAQAHSYYGYEYGYGYTEVDAAIDYYGLPPIFHYIAYRESRDDPYAVNPYSGACGPFQFLPSTAAYYGYTCWDLQDPYVAAQAAYELWWDYGLTPWGY